MTLGQDACNVMPLGRKPIKLKYDETTRCTYYFQLDFDRMIDGRLTDYYLLIAQFDNRIVQILIVYGHCILQILQQQSWYRVIFLLITFILLQY